MSLRVIKRKREMIRPKLNKGQKFSEFCSLLAITCAPMQDGT